jgi:CheY-like chemotaxis protein
MTRSAALRSQGGAKAPAPARPAASLAEHPPSATLPPARIERAGAKTAPSAPPTPPEDGPKPARRKAEVQADADARPKAEDGVTLAALLAELRAVRETQHLILEAIEDLRKGGAAPAGRPVAAAGPADQEVAGAGGIGLSPIRDRRRKTVVLVDDDPETRQAAVAELEHGDVPVRAFDDGNAALTAIAEEKPDVIVLEVGMGGDMGGKDLVNFVKATMEWVDIPIILWTREPIASQKEARQIHGADEVVPKSGGAAALLARVITVFRRA